MNILTKICSKCRKDLDLSCFHKNKTKKDGLQSQCNTCKKDWNKENIEKVRKYKIKWRKENPEQGKRWRKENLEKVKKSIRMWKKLNPQKVLAMDSKRRAKKLNATPEWLTKEHLEEIQDLYVACRAFRLFTGLTYHVDHIVPLLHPLVCGLHVPWNLQILEASENIRKNNKFEIE